MPIAPGIIKKNVLLMVTCGLLTLIPLQAQEAQLNRNLSLLNPGTSTSLRLRDDQVIADVELLAIDAHSLTYRNQGMTVKLEREMVYRARQGDAFYSDLPLTAADHQRFPDYVSYISERGDVIVDVDRNQFVGKIIAETDAAMTIRTRAANYDIAKAKIAAWRRDGKWYGDSEAQQQPATSIFGVQPYMDKKRLLNYSIFFTGPWSALPQLGIGMGSNVNHLLFGGLRTSLGYIWLDTQSMGLLFQASAYLNLNLLQFGNTRIFAGSSYLWRAGMLFSTGPSASGRYSQGVYADITQNIYTLHLGMKYMNFIFEAGVEMPIVRRQSFTAPAPRSVLEIADNASAVNQLQSTIDRFNDVSRVYVMMGLLF